MVEKHGVEAPPSQRRGGSNTQPQQNTGYTGPTHLIKTINKWQERVAKTRNGGKYVEISTIELQELKDAILGGIQDENSRGIKEILRVTKDIQ
jgi:hypothetical protein